MLERAAEPGEALACPRADNTVPNPTSQSHNQSVRNIVAPQYLDAAAESIRGPFRAFHGKRLRRRYDKEYLNCPPAYEIN